MTRSGNVTKHLTERIEIIQNQIGSLQNRVTCVKQDINDLESWNTRHRGI